MFRALPRSEAPRSGGVLASRGSAGQRRLSAQGVEPGGRGSRAGIGKINALFCRQEEYCWEEYCWASEQSITRDRGRESGRISGSEGHSIGAEYAISRHLAVSGECRPKGGCWLGELNRSETGIDMRSGYGEEIERARR
jgi:hypothetical protein